MADSLPVSKGESESDGEHGDDWYDHEHHDDEHQRIGSPARLVIAGVFGSWHSASVHLCSSIGVASTGGAPAA
jgi:hypothetical protein